MSRYRNQRLEKIQNKLILESTSTIDDLAEFFEVSTATIRRDLKVLEQEGSIVQTIGGGVMYRSDYSHVPAENLLETVNVEQKIRIGEYCVNLVEHHDEIIVSPGTTMLMAGRILSGIANISFRLITNSLDLARDLSHVENIGAVLLGGEVSDSYTTGYTSHEDFFATCHKKHKFFMTADGVDVHGGVTHFSSRFVALCRKMISVSSEVYVLCDSSKLEKVTFNRVANLDIVTKVITDNDAPESFLRGCATMGVEVVTV